MKEHLRQMKITEKTQGRRAQKRKMRVGTAGKNYRGRKRICRARDVSSKNIARNKRRHRKTRYSEKMHNRSNSVTDASRELAIGNSTILRTGRWVEQRRKALAGKKRIVLSEFKVSVIPYIL